MHRFNPTEIFEVAKQLLAGDGEAHIRSAASRAYYAVFLVARDLAEIDDKSAEVHLRTQLHYASIGEEEIAKGLKFLRLRRNDADYATKRLFSRAESKEAMSRSRVVGAALGALAGRMQYKRMLKCGSVVQRLVGRGK